MKDITQLINRKSYEENQIEKFNNLLSAVSTKRKQRKLEMHLLKPKPISKYKGIKSGMSNFKKSTVLFSFPDSICVQKLEKIVIINKYIENNCHDVFFLVELIRLIESGRIEWHKRKKRYYVNARNGGRIRL